MSLWFEKPIRIADLMMEEFIPEKIPDAVRTRKKLDFDVEHLGVSEVRGGERGVFYYTSSMAENVPVDFLGPYLLEAHRSGIRVLIYFNVHWLAPEFGRKHSDWLQLKRDRTPIDTLYGKGMSPCVNSPGYRDWSFQVIRDLAGYDIDGIFLDGPIFIANGCYCEACASGFRGLTGMALPEAEDWEDDTWKAFIEFRYDSITRYMKDSRAILREMKPDAVIYMNGQGLWPSWPNGRDNRRLAPHQDIVGAEGGFIGGNLARSPLWKPAMSAKLIETQASGKPTVIFISGHNCGWDNYQLTAAETELLYAGTIANGASPWYGVFFQNAGGEGAQAAGRMNRFISANAEYLEKTTSVAKVALMWSVKTADYYRATVPVTDFTQEGEKLTRQVGTGDHFAAFSGWFEALTRSHIPFDVLDEQGIEELLGRYDALVLPNAACMADSVAAKIADWTRSGGTLACSAETSFYDEWGKRRSMPALAEVLGFTPVGIDGPCDLDYFDRGDHELFRGISESCIPSPRIRILTELRGAKALSFYRERLPARYQPLPPLSRYPAITEQAYGKGKSISFCGTMDELYAECHFPEHEILLAGPARAGSRNLLQTDAPSSVAISIREQKARGRTIVHLINYTGEMVRPIRRIIPIHGIRMGLPWLKNIRRARLLKAGKDVAFSVSAGFEAEVPVMESYEVLVIE